MINLQFKECKECAAKPGMPTLCESCLHNRSVISSLQSKEKTVGQEGVHTVFINDELVAIIRRDSVSGKHLCYSVKEMVSEDISNLIKE